METIIIKPKSKESIPFLKHLLQTLSDVESVEVIKTSENQNDLHKRLFYLFISNSNKKVCFIFNLKNNVHICIKLFRKSAPEPWGRRPLGPLRAGNIAHLNKNPGPPKELQDLCFSLSFSKTRGFAPQAAPGTP